MTSNNGQVAYRNEDIEEKRQAIVRDAMRRTLLSGEEARFYAGYIDYDEDDPETQEWMNAPMGDPQANAPSSAPVRRKLPDTRRSVTHKFRVGDTDGYITVGLYEDGTPGEVFINVSKAGSTVNGLFDAWATQVSYSLQYGVPIAKIADKFTGTRFEPSGMTGNPDIPVATSILDYVARWLQRRFCRIDLPWKTLGVNKSERTDVYDPPPWHGEFCPECPGLLVPGEGCSSCPQCGYSKCG